MPFLRNAWYVAAWDDEVPASDFFHRRILGEDIMFARDADSAVHALRNRCPHRFAPLNLGSRTGAGLIQCPYHGLQFDLAGRCRHNPHGDGAIPPGATVRSYPVVSRHMLLWIWMGEAERADADLIPYFQGLDPDRYAINRGYMHTAANYEYMTDNIMDLGHIEFLHEGLLGSEAVRHADIEVVQQGTTIHSNRLTHDEVLPAPLDRLYGTNGAPVDRWLDVRWDAPALMEIVIGVTPAGSPPRVGKEAPGVHLMTPETEDSNHYFWASSRDFAKDDAELHEAMQRGFEYAFEQQDKPMILAQHEAIGGEDFWDIKPVILPCDAGAVRARRVLRKLIREEQAI